MKPYLAVLATAVIASAAITASNAKTAEPAGGPPGKWVYIGSSHATHFNDHDTIALTGPHDNFRMLKIGVDGASLHMQRMVVTFDNGAMFNIPVRYNIQKGSETEAIPLKSGGGRRSLQKVDFWYDTKGWLHGTANVRLYGMH